MTPKLCFLFASFLILALSSAPTNALECYFCNGEGCNEIYDDTETFTCGTVEPTESPGSTEPTHSGTHSTDSGSTHSTQTDSTHPTQTDSTTSPTTQTDTTTSPTTQTDTTTSPTTQTDTTTTPTTQTDTTTSPTTQTDTTTSPTTQTDTTTPPTTQTDTTTSPTTQTDTTTSPTTQSDTTTSPSTQTDPTTSEPTVPDKLLRFRPSVVRSIQRRDTALSFRKLIKPYEDPIYKCVKIVYNGDDDKTMTKRGCEIATSEQEDKDAVCKRSLGDTLEVKECGVCDSDLCNPAAKATFSAMLLLPVLAIVAYMH